MRPANLIALFALIAAALALWAAAPTPAPVELDARGRPLRRKPAQGDFAVWGSEEVGGFDVER